MLNMYDFAATWNPLCGSCRHLCSYCYVEAMKKRYPVMAEKYSGKPLLSEKAMRENLNLKKYNGKVIFVESMGDLFADNVPFDLIEEVLYHCKIYYENTYFFQSKNAPRLLSFSQMDGMMPENSIFCTTIETNRDYKLSVAPPVINRAKAMNEIKGIKHLTLEPLCDFDLLEMLYLIDLCGVSQCNIGADSKGHNLPEPSKEKILQLIDGIKKLGIIVHEKSNLNRLTQ